MSHELTYLFKIVPRCSKTLYFHTEKNLKIYCKGGTVLSPNPFPHSSAPHLYIQILTLSLDKRSARDDKVFHQTAQPSNHCSDLPADL